MPSQEHSSQPRTLTDYIGVLRRRLWLAALPVLIVPIAGYLYSAQQQKLYGASSEVLLSRQDLGSTVTGRTNPDVFTDPERFAQTQAALARVPEVAGRAIERAGVKNMTPGTLLAHSSVTPHGNADVLRFTVDNPDPLRAATLSAAYATSFTDFRLELDTATLKHARSDLERSLRGLRKNGQADTQLYRDLVAKAQELRTIELLQTKPTVVKAAKKGQQVAPTPMRSAMLGVALGLVLGLAAAFLWDALDKRVRDENEIESTLGLPLLARLPEPPSRGDGSRRLVMLEDPTALDADAVRRLRTNVEFANLDLNAKLVLITSAVGAEGKSLTVAELAVALARSGRRVALVDLDLRKPSLGRLFETGVRPGVTDVAIGRIDLGTALYPVHLKSGSAVPATRRWGPDVTTDLADGTRPDDAPGQLYVLPAGFVPANPGEFVGTHAVGSILSQLRERMDLVLIDAPPLLLVSDAVTLSRLADALLVVTRIGVVNRSMLKELSRELEACPAPKLGFVLTGAESLEHYGGAYATRKKPEAAGAPAATAHEGAVVYDATFADGARAEGGATRGFPRRT